MEKAEQVCANTRGIGQASANAIVNHRRKEPMVWRFIFSQPSRSQVQWEQT